MCLHRIFFGIVIFSSLAGEHNNMVTCSSKTRLTCSLHTYKPDCNPHDMIEEYPSLFSVGTSVPTADFPINFKSKIVLSDRIIGVMLIWQQYVRKLTPNIQGFQIIMVGKDGIDVGASRCFILQIQNKSSLVMDSYETFYLIIEDLQPMSSYNFNLYNLPTYNPFQQVHRMIQTDVDTHGYEDYFMQFSGNWVPYIECRYIYEKETLHIRIELPPQNYTLTLFDVSIYGDGIHDFGTININSSMFNIHWDQIHLFTNGYIILSHLIPQITTYLEVWVTPVDTKSYSSTECLCFLRNRHCIPCPTATTKCPVDKVGVQALHNNISHENDNRVVNNKADLIAWLCVGGVLLCACVCALLVFRRRHESCKDISRCTNAETTLQDANLNNEPLHMREIPDSGHSPCLSNRNGGGLGVVEASLPLVDSYNHEQCESDIIVMTENLFYFIPPESSSDTISKTLSEQMVEINREFLPTERTSSLSDNISYSDLILEARSLGGESV